MSTRIDFNDATASLELLRSVAEYFLPLETANEVIEECRSVVQQWQDFAHKRGAPQSEIKIMMPAFEHEDFSRAPSRKQKISSGS